MIAACLYVAAVLIANYTATWFIEMPVFGLVSVAVFIFGITFTLRDYVHQLGRRYVYLMIAVTAVANVVLCLLTDTPWRVILASFTAIVLAEAVDTEFYHRLNLPWIKRVAASNAVSIPLDSLLFNGIAFLGVFEPEMLVAIIFGEVFFKTLMGIVTGVPRWVCLRSSTVQVAIAGSPR